MSRLEKSTCIAAIVACAVAVVMATILIVQHAAHAGAAASRGISPPADDGPAPARVTRVAAAYAMPTVPDGRLLIAVAAAGTVPGSGGLAPLLMPRRRGLSADGFLEYDFRYIPDGARAVGAEAMIVAEGGYSFAPGASPRPAGVRVFGASGTVIEVKLH